MTSVKTAAAIAVVAVIVIAVGAFAVLNGGVAVTVPTLL